MIGKVNLTGGPVLGRVALGLAGLGLAVCAVPAMAQSTVATGVGTPFELAFWQSIDTSSDASLYEAYLARFPNGTFNEIARAKIITLQGRNQAPTPVSTPSALTVPVAPAAAPIAPPARPAPAEVRVMQPAVPVVQPTAAVAPVASPAVMTPAVATTTSASAAGTLGQLLAALAVSQSNEGGAQANAASMSGPSQPAMLQSATLVTSPTPIAPAPAPHATAVSFAIPAQPRLTAVPAVAFPPSFCSAEQRNAFHDQVYAPSVSVAQRNNEAAAGYLRQLQALYDQYQMSRDPDTMNAIVVAARTYEQVAQTTFSMQAGLVRQFGALMAVPVVACAQPAQPTAALLVK